MNEEIVRAHDWEERLACYLDLCSERPFLWGQHDCALFAAGAIKAMTGVDPAADFRGKYDDARGAAAALRELGSGTLYHTVCSWLGQPKPISLAHRGDIVMRNKALGVSVGTFAWFAGEEQSGNNLVQGLVSIPVADCDKAWGISYG